MKRWLVIPVALLSLLPAQAMADRMSYSYVQLTNLLDTDISVGSFDKGGDSFGGKVGWIMGPYVFADLRYDDLAYGSGLDGHEGEARLGYRQRLEYAEGDPQRLDWYGTINYENLKIDTVTDKDGWGVNAGLRYSPARWLEVTGELGYLDYGSPHAMSYVGDIQLNTSRYFAFVFEYRKQVFSNPGPDLDRKNFSVGLRLMFGGG